MSNYLEKYKKYKLKYLNKKQQKGGAIDLIFDLEKYKGVYRKFVLEFKHEMAFSLDIDPDNGHLISEIIKGNEFIKEDGADYKMKLFNKKLAFTHINCHTHDKYSGIAEGYHFTPPSSGDFKEVIENYCKYHTPLHLVFADEGIYEISLGEKIIELLNNEPLSLMRWVYAPTHRRYTSTRTFPEWEEFQEKLLDRINTIHILAIKPNAIPLDEYEKIRTNYMAMFETSSIDTIDEYLEEIRKLNFNIKIYKWDEPLIIKLTIPQNVHKFINATIKAKKGGYLMDILLANNDNFLENNDNDVDNEYLNYDLNKNNYIDISKKPVNV